MTKRVQRFLYLVLETAINSVLVGHSEQATMTIHPGSAGHLPGSYPFHIMVQKLTTGEVVARSNDLDLFSGQAPSLLVRMQSQHRACGFTRQVYKAVAPHVVHDYIEARVSFDGPLVWVGNSNFGSLGPKPDSYTL